MNPFAMACGPFAQIQYLDYFRDALTEHTNEPLISPNRSYARANRQNGYRLCLNDLVLHAPHHNGTHPCVTHHRGSELETTHEGGRHT